jgi:hypothetical protein
VESIVKVDSTNCSSCGAALAHGARFCSFCGTRVLVKEEDATVGIVHDKKPHYCPICGRATTIAGSFRCVVCGREHLCLSHQKPRQIWEAVGTRVEIPACCEECARTEMQRRRGAIETVKAQRKCAVCGMLACPYQCGACGRYYCYKHQEKKMHRHFTNQYESRDLTFRCPTCGEICRDCVDAGILGLGRARCRKCGGTVEVLG